MTWAQDAAEHAGYALLVFGQLAVAHRVRAGWWMRLAGELAWIAIGLQLRSTSIVGWGLAAAVVELHGALRAER